MRIKVLITGMEYHAEPTDDTRTIFGVLCCDYRWAWNALALFLFQKVFINIAVRDKIPP
jgi:hypothetical protein